MVGLAIINGGIGVGTARNPDIWGRGGAPLLHFEADMGVDDAERWKSFCLLTATCNSETVASMPFTALACTRSAIEEHPCTKVEEMSAK